MDRLFKGVKPFYYQMVDEDKSKPNLINAKRIILHRMNVGLSDEEINSLETEDEIVDLIEFFNKAAENTKIPDPKKGEKPKFSRIANSGKKNIEKVVESEDKKFNESTFDVNQVFRPNTAWHTEKMLESEDGGFIIRRHNINGRFNSRGEMI